MQMSDKYNYLNWNVMLIFFSVIIENVRRENAADKSDTKLKRGRRDAKIILALQKSKVKLCISK